MKIQRLLIALTVINLGLLAFTLAQIRLHIGSQGIRVWTNVDGSVLRGRALEIVDGQGNVRASINVYPADPIRPYPETALFRLIDQEGRPSVKLAVVSDRGGGLLLATNQQGNYVQLSGEGMKVTKDGQPQTIP
jgi:hypothetical protein